MCSVASHTIHPHIFSDCAAFLNNNNGDGDGDGDDDGDGDGKDGAIQVCSIPVLTLLSSLLPVTLL